MLKNCDVAQARIRQPLMGEDSGSIPD